VEPYSPGATLDRILEQLAWFLDELIAALVSDRGQSYVIGDGGTATSSAFGKYVHNEKLSVTSISRQFGTICDGVCQTAIRSGLELHGRDYQTMNAMVDAAISAAIEGFVGDDRKEAIARHADDVNAVLHEISNAHWAARAAFDTLREGTVGLKSMTSEVLDRALRRIDALVAGNQRDRESLS
jgi:hypothetical protein